MTVRRPDQGVKWLLAGMLLRKIVSIGRSLLVNEFDIRDWMYGGSLAETDYHTDRNSVWFDYIADTGDDPYVMMKVAETASRQFSARSLEGQNDHPDLPVGDFLFVGGDLAYVVPDETTMRFRFVAPFREGIARSKPPARPVFAIPGNHDYYDEIVGFNRLFRRPYPAGTSGVMPITGLVPVQEATYVKIRLPGEWELWAVDLSHHGIDYRQLEYFRQGATGAPARLVLCTHAPPIARGRVDVDKAALESYERLLGITAPAFAPGIDGTVPQAGTCRLHLCGHVHHYVRYGGPAPHSELTTNLATVVSGAGGAFLHPTEHDAGEVPAAVKYPTPAESRPIMARALTSPSWIIRGGYLHVLGALLALVFYATIPSGPAHIGGAIAWTAVLFLGGGMIAGAVGLTRLAGKRRAVEARRSRPLGTPTQHPNGRRVSNWFIFAGILLALALPFAVHRALPEMDPLAPESVAVLLATLLLLGLALVGRFVGGPPHPNGFTILGAAHGSVQVALPYLLTRAGWATSACALAALLVLGRIGRHLYVARRRVALTIWWMLQGPVIGAAVAWKCWLNTGTGGATLWLLAIVAGALIAPIQFGHYVLVASAWDGHYNEAGATARNTGYKQFIRFCCSPARLTGYVIGLDTPDADPRLVDVFHIAP